MSKGAVVARIVSEYSDKGTNAAVKDFKKLSKDSHGLGKQFEELGKKFIKAFAIVEVAKFGLEAVKSAEAANGAFMKMNIAFANTGSTLNSNSPQVQKAIEEMSSLAFTGTETADALARGATSFHSASKAMDNLSLAANISRTTGMGLTESMVALGKAASGKVPKSLAALGVIMPKNGTAAEKYKQITDQLTASLKGQAEAYAQTHPIEVMKAKFEELSVSIGQLLMPAFNVVTNFLTTKVIPAILLFVNFLRANPQYFQPFVNEIVSIINVLAKLAVIVLDIVAVFLKLDSVILQVVRGMAWLLGNNEMKDWAKNAADSLGAASTSVKKLSDKVNGFHMNAVKLKATSPIVVKGMGDITKATNTATDATGKLTAQQIKSLAALKALGIAPTTSTDAIELEAARLNIVKQQGIEADIGYQKLMANYEAMMANNVAAQRYADILGVIADNNISTAEIDLLSKKWGLTKDQVVAYIGKVFEVPALMDPTEAARLGFSKSLDLLDQVIAKIKIVNTPLTPGAGAPYTLTSGATVNPQEGTLVPKAGSNAPQILTPEQLASLAINASPWMFGGTDSTTGMTNSIFSTASFAASNASTMSTGQSTAASTTVNFNLDGTTIATAVIPAVTNGILQNQISGKNIVYSGFAV